MPAIAYKHLPLCVTEARQGLWFAIPTVPDARVEDHALQALPTSEYNPTTAFRSCAYHDLVVVLSWHPKVKLDGRPEAHKVRVPSPCHASVQSDHCNWGG